MLHRFKDSTKLQYARIFFKTILKEWGMLDKHRIDKFYFLIRQFIKEIFILLLIKTNKLDTKNVQEWINMLYDEVLCKTPGGVKYHVIDVYIEELENIGSEVIKTNTFLQMIKPFITLLETSYDSAIIDRICRRVFEDLIEKVSIENKKSFSKVNLLVLQKYVFDIASDPALKLEKNRHILYDIHKMFQKATKVEVVSDKEIQSGDNNIKNNKNNNNNSDSGNNNNNNNNTDSIDMNNDDSKKDKKKDKKKEKKRILEDSEEKKKNKKLKVDKSSPSSDDQKKNNNNIVIDWTNPETLIKLPKYIASKTYSGGRLGYVFKLGPKGLGFYQDSKEFKRAQSAARKGLLNDKSSKSKNMPTINDTHSLNNGSLSEILESIEKKKEKKKSKISLSPSSSSSSPSMKTPPIIDKKNRTSSTSSSKKGVSFGKNIEKSYEDSIRGLKGSLSSPDSTTPTKSALKKAKINSSKKHKFKK